MPRRFPGTPKQTHWCAARETPGCPIAIAIEKKYCPNHAEPIGADRGEALGRELAKEVKYPE